MKPQGFICMQSKVSVILLKSKAIDNSSDINKMTVHLEQVLAEREKVDLKTRQSLTDANIKGSDYIVFCGYDTAILSEFFKALSVIEGLEGAGEGPQLFLYDEPGQSIEEHLNRVLTQGTDLRRIDPKIFKKIVSTWSYRDIIATVDIGIRKLGIDATTDSSSDTNPGDAPKAPRA
jgi:hypothetical protein